MDRSAAKTSVRRFYDESDRRGSFDSPHQSGQGREGSQGSGGKHYPTNN